MTYIYLWLHPKQGSLALHKTITADIIIDIIKWGFYGRKMFDRLERKTHSQRYSWVLVWVWMRKRNENHNCIEMREAIF